MEKATRRRGGGGATRKVAIQSPVLVQAAMLLKNSTLSYISLRHNAITDDGCMALQRALVHNYTVKRLSVDHNPEVSERSFMTLGYSITLNNEPILLKQVIPQVWC